MCLQQVKKVSAGVAKPGLGLLTQYKHMAKPPGKSHKVFLIKGSWKNARDLSTTFSFLQRKKSQQHQKKEVFKIKKSFWYRNPVTQCVRKFESCPLHFAILELRNKRTLVLCIFYFQKKKELEKPSKYRNIRHLIFSLLFHSIYLSLFQIHNRIFYFFSQYHPLLFSVRSNLKTNSRSCFSKAF